MQTENSGEFARLSAECQWHLRSGVLDWYSFDLKQVATLFGREQKYIDKTKTLMLAFYIHLSGQSPFVDRTVVVGLKNAIRKSGLDNYQVKELYLNIAHTEKTPKHLMTVSDSLYLLELSLENRNMEVGAIIDNFRLISNVK